MIMHESFIVVKPEPREKGFLSLSGRCLLAVSSSQRAPGRWLCQPGTRRSVPVSVYVVKPSPR